MQQRQLSASTGMQGLRCRVQELGYRVHRKGGYITPIMENQTENIEMATGITMGSKALNIWQFPKIGRPHHRPQDTSPYFREP